VAAQGRDEKLLAGGLGDTTAAKAQVKVPTGAVLQALAWPAVKNALLDRRDSGVVAGSLAPFSASSGGAPFPLFCRPGGCP